MLSLYRKDWIRRKFSNHADNICWLVIIVAVLYFAWHLYRFTEAIS